MKRILFVLGMAAAAAFTATAQQAGPVVMTPVKQDVSADLYSMMILHPSAPDAPPSEVVQKHGPLIDEVGSADRATFSAAPTATYLQNDTLSKPSLLAAPGINFEALGVGTASFSILGAPPDTTMAVGPNHIVQWVNSQFAIYNKSGNPLLPAPGFVVGNTLFTGFGGLCESSNRGDPLVAYDKIADRWVFSQFAFNTSGSSIVTPYLQCFAVSTGPNPAGPYNRYAYDFGTDFNDYGKIGVWPDAYYVTYNSFLNAGSNNGVLLCAYDRAAMIAGTVAVSICAPTNFYGGGASLLPADMEGATQVPPAGAANYMIRQGTGAPAGLRLFRFKVNSFSPASITFNDGQGGALGTFVNIPVTMTRACNGAAGTCIPQLGTTNLLDTLGDRLMYRFGYRNRGGVESLTVNMSADPDGAGAQGAAIRWFEIRNPSAATPVLFQNSQFNPDTTNRWMGSMAMDKNGNIAIGYSASNATINPGIRITGRLRSDIRNQMQAEAVIQNGTGSQTGTLTRWGDYSTMRVDPADDCTFWFTTEYIGASGTFNWRTRIASFKFANCTP